MLIVSVVRFLSSKRISNIMSNQRPPLLQFSRDDVEIIDKKNEYQGFFALDKYTVRHKLYRGGYSNVLTREIFERGDAVALLPYDPITDTVVLIEQFRLGAIRDNNTPWQLEVVAGMFDKDEQPVDVAIREAKEEANIDVNIENISKIMDYLSSSGGTTERLHLYCGLIDSANVGGIFGLADEGEDILVHVLKREEAYTLLKQGKITNAATVIALQWLMLNFDSLDLL